MWKINADGTHAKNKRADCTAFVTAAVIVNDEYETRIESMHGTLDEAKAALSKFVATENAEEAQDLWQIDDDGDAYNDATDQFISCGKLDNGYAVFITIGGKGLKVLDFALSEDHARYLIWQIANKLNEKVTS